MSEISQPAEAERSIEKIIAQYWEEEIERALDETGRALVADLRPKVWARLDEQSQDEFHAWAARRKELPFPWPCPSDEGEIQDWFNSTTGLYARTVDRFEE